MVLQKDNINTVRKRVIWQSVHHNEHSNSHTTNTRSLFYNKLKYKRS